MKITHVIIIIGGLIVLGGFAAFGNVIPSATSPTPTPDSYVNIPGYVDFSETTLLRAQQKGTPILFFAATKWCTTCSAFEEEVLKRKGEIPPDVTILKVDYDNDAYMNESYQVTNQHTLVMLDQSGTELTRWVGGDFDLMLQELQEI